MHWGETVRLGALKLSRNDGSSTAYESASKKSRRSPSKKSSSSSSSSLSSSSSSSSSGVGEVAVVLQFSDRSFATLSHEQLRQVSNASPCHVMLFRVVFVVVV
jgi:hypothetical protein